ncbi:GntR family transcriptional regulator [Arthrobacter sp. 35/47]|nr:GntR family transcriptional regulator [Arthrobacter sp. 35/47]
MNSSVGDGLSVSPSGNVPLHLQLRNHLRAQIVNHSLPPGAALPSEAQLQAQFGVSRSVVRQALGALAAEGLIDRGRGRGSTVAPRREHHRLVQRMPGLSTQISETGVSVQTEVLGFEVETARGMAAALGTPEALALKRLRSVDGSPIALIHTWLPLPLCADLRAEDLQNASLHGVLREKLGIDVTAGRRQIRAAPADSDLLSLLRMEAHSPVLLLEGTSVDASGRTVEVFTTWHHADQVVFDIDVVNDTGDASDGFTHSPGLKPEKTEEDIPSEITGVGYRNLEPLSERAHALAVELDRFAKEVRGGRIRQP